MTAPAATWLSSGVRISEADSPGAMGDTATAPSAPTVPAEAKDSVAEGELAKLF